MSLEATIAELEKKLTPEWRWLVRADSIGYFANIYSIQQTKRTRRYPAAGATPEKALCRALDAFMEVEGLR